MARVTVEDSLQNVENRFSLVLLAAKRARDLMMSGVNPEIEWEDDKSTVVALREIAAGKIQPDYLLKKSPEVIETKKTYSPEIDDFDLDDDANAALIAALSESSLEDAEIEDEIDADKESETQQAKEAQASEDDLI